MKKVSLYIVVIIFVFIGCNKENQTNLVNEFSLNDTIQIAFGDSFYNPNEKISITFDSVISDTRCPLYAYCIWAGNAIVSFHISANSTSVPFELDTFDGNAYSSDTIINDFVVELIQLEPYPEIGVERLQEKYKATIVVSKR